MRCSVQNCNSDTKRTTKSHGITFHMFPKEPSLRTAWMEALGISDWEPRERSTVCSEHFHNNDFYLTKNGLRKIKNGAVPVVIKDSSEDLEAPAALRVCRVCLVMDTKMYNITEHKLNLVYEQVVGMSFTDGDKLPQKICWECAHRLVSANRLKIKALRSQTLLYELLDPERYITVRDVKSINRAQNNLKSPLVWKHFDPNDCDTHIQDNQVVVKQENGDSGDREGDELEKEELNSVENASDGGLKEEMAADIKDETSNEIFLEAFADNNFDESDDMALSEVYAHGNKAEKTEKKRKKAKVKKKTEKKPVKRRAGSESPTSTMDKYRTNDVKRRAAHDNIDESLFTVTRLTYDEQAEEVRRRQHSAAYAAAAYQCAACFRGFQRRDRYDAHAQRHSEQSGAYECFICRTRLKTARALRKHLTAQHTLKYSCKGCSFVTRNKGVAREHEKWHAGAKYQCPHCPSEFDKLTTYLGHLRIKHVSDFVCELCGFTFVSKKGIDVHKKKKHRLAESTVIDGPYCETCDVRFVSEEAHDRHLKLSSKHSSDDDPNRIRNDSQNQSSCARKVERRPAIHRPPDARPAAGPVSCEQCGVQLRDLRLYAQHFRRAHPDKNRTKYPAMKTPCMCEQCGRIFQSMALLKDHMWVHTGEKRFKCERCDKSFTQKTNLVFHMRSHSAARPSYECPLCGKHFAFYNNRRRHMFIHTGLKPYKCETCGKSFTTAGEQRAHVEHVHMKKPWPKRARGPRPPGGWRECGAPMED